MWISDTSIKRPVFATMFILSFVVLGIVSMTRLGIDLFPDVNFPFVNVSVIYRGAAPAEGREKVPATRSRLPQESEDPTIERFDVAALPIMVFAVGSSQPSD